MPVNGISWSEEAVEWFHMMVHNRTLYARLYPRGCEVTVELFFQRGMIGVMRCITKDYIYLLFIIIYTPCGCWVVRWLGGHGTLVFTVTCGVCISGGVHRCLGNCPRMDMHNIGMGVLWIQVSAADLIMSSRWQCNRLSAAVVISDLFLHRWLCFTF